MRRNQFFFFFLIAHCLTGQMDTVLRLPEVVVTRNQDQLLSGVGGNISIDSLQQIYHSAVALSQVPAFQQSGYINYGPGRLSTLGLRGAPSRQVALFWEDVPLNNPMIGVSDLSILVNGPRTKLSLKQGVWAVREGTGASAGSISIKEQVPHSDGLALSMISRFASYGNRDLMGSAQFSKNRWNTSVSGGTSRGDNDLRYNRFGENRRLPNAAHEHSHLKWTGAFSPGSDHIIKAGSWIMGYERNIPPTRLQNVSSAIEEGSSWYNYIAHEWRGDKLGLKTLLSYARQEFAYQDPDLGLDQSNVSDQFFLKQRAFGHRGPWQWNASWEAMMLDAKSPNYRENSQIFRGAVEVGLSREFKHWNLDMYLRQDVSEESAGWPVTNVIMVRNISPVLIWFAGLGTHFRWPVMDDLFWVPGGDPTLKPEHGWNGEMGWKWNKESDRKGSADLSVTAFYRKQVESIQWYPDGSIWTASNTGPLQSFGLIMQGQIIRHYGEHMLRADMNVQFIRADRLNNNDNLQEIYVPMWTGHFNVLWQYRAWGCLLKNQYRSQRYYLNSESSLLPSVNLTDFHVSYSGSIFDTGIRVQIGLNNIFNVEHEWVIHRPMPGRTLEGTLTVTL